MQELKPHEGAAVSVLLVDFRGYWRKHGQIVPLVKSRSKFEAAIVEENASVPVEDTDMLAWRWGTKPEHLLVSMSGIPVIR